MIWLPAGGAKSPPSAETIARGEHYIRMEGRETYRFATRTMATTALASVAQGRPRARRHRPVHPAPGQHPDHRGGRQGPRPADGQDVREPRPYGNTSAASVPIALAEAVNGGRIERRRHDRASSPSGPASPPAPSPSSGPPIPAAGSRATRPSTRRRPCPPAGRLGLGRPDPGRPGGDDGAARDRRSAARRRRPRTNPRQSHQEVHA